MERINKISGWLTLNFPHIQRYELWWMDTNPIIRCTSTDKRFPKLTAKGIQASNVTNLPVSFTITTTEIFTKLGDMRILLSITRNQTIVPYDNIPALVGSLHKWLGLNEWHNQLSLYSFSWLKGGESGNNGLYFPRGAEWFISAHESTFIKKLIQGIQDDPIINYGLRVKAITIQEPPQFNENHSFTLASPVLIKRKEGEMVKHYLYSDKQADKLITETLMTKLKKAGLNPDGVQVSFKRDYPYSKTKLVNYNGIGNKASICPITIKGTPEQIAFAWNVGIGNSTGIGFGALN